MTRQVVLDSLEYVLSERDYLRSLVPIAHGLGLDMTDLFRRIRLLQSLYIDLEWELQKFL